MATVLLVTFVLPEVSAQSLVPPPYQVIDPGTIGLVETLTKSGALQLILIAPILIVIFQSFSGVAGFFKSRQEAKSDDKIINRMIDNNALLSQSIDKLAEATRYRENERLEMEKERNRLEQERIDMHQINSDRIMAQLSIHVQQLGKQQLDWSKTVVESLALVQDELRGVRGELQTLQQAVKAPPMRAQLQTLFHDLGRDILRKLDQILERLPDPKAPPPTEPDAAAPKAPLQLNADGAAHDARVEAEGSDTNDKDEAA